MTRPAGPRVIFKDDRDSAIGRGAILYGAHFRAEVSKIVYVVAQTAPHHLDVVVISEGWRDTRDTRDLHEESRALDVSLRDMPGGEIGSQMAESWCHRLRDTLGPDYDVQSHGDGDNWHLHIELDP